MGQFVQVINATGTTVWVAPAGVTSVKVELWGGGGGGGQPSVAGGGGGGGGGYRTHASYTVTPGNSYNVVVGAGGSGAGQNSSFDGTGVVANGGAVGGNAGGVGGTTQGTGGAGGGGSGTGTTGFTGGAGGGGGVGTANGGGGGGGAGSAATGQAGNTNGTGGAGRAQLTASITGVGGTGATAVAVGTAGSILGGGGGGASAANPATSGARGAARLTWTAPSGSGDDTITLSDTPTKIATFIRNPGPFVQDHSANGRHGTLTDTQQVALVTSPFSGFDKAYKFDKTTGSSVNAGATGTGVSSSFTFEFRVRWQNVNSGDQLMGRYDSSSANQNFQIGINNTASWIANVRRDTGGQVSLSAGGGNNAVVDTNYHIALVYSLANTRLYMFKDGVEIQSTGSVNGLQAPDAITPLFLGRVANSGAPARMAAIIDEVRLSNVARYTTGFTPSATPFTTDANTLLLYHLDNKTDLLTLSDVATTSVGYGRVASDTTTLSDVISKKPQLNKSDSLALSDAQTKVIGVNKTDTITLSDQNTRIVSYYRQLSDTTTLSDAISKQTTKNFADSFSGSAVETEIVNPTYVLTTDGQLALLVASIEPFPLYQKL